MIRSIETVHEKKIHGSRDKNLPYTALVGFKYVRVTLQLYTKVQGSAIIFHVQLDWEDHSRLLLVPIIFASAVMILGQISYLDCLIFLILLAPQLLIEINVIQLAVCVLSALPFICETLTSPVLQHMIPRLTNSKSSYFRIRFSWKEYLLQ